ncbi:TIGR01459 family HAD-type hydrolase [Ravibacter arvi]|uniref:TIGR01459 family HAD-type hydrolase n=1 Tax=Ravibacter arvi TaxID=2051041 RepID=A0ABP8MBV2_9BACT
MELTDFKVAIDKYKVIFFDAFGVLKTYNALIPGIEATFAYLKETGKEFYILTNDASRSPEQLVESYHKLGVYDIVPETIVSSGMLAREYLQYKVENGTVAYLGTANSAHYLKTAGLKALPISEVDLDNTDDISALVFMDDEGFDWNNDLNKTLNLLRKKTIPVIVANTDKTYPMGRKSVAIAIGAVAKMIEDIVGKQFMRFGKPDAQMFIFAYQHILNNAGVSRNDILMVGDTLHTDILGGNKFGLDTALVLTGNTRLEEVDLRIRSTGIIPTYVCESAVVK